MRFISRVLFWGMVLVALTLPGWVWLQSRDLPQIDDRDLTPRRYEVPIDHDGVRQLDSAVQLLDLSEEESRFTALSSVNEYWDAAVVRDLLARNAEALATLDGALTATYFKAPPSSESPAMIGWQRLAKLLVLRAGFAMSEGDPWAAASDYQRVLTLGARVEQALEGSLLTAKIGLSLRELALQSIYEHARAGLLPNAIGLELAAAMPAFRSNPETWAALWRIEYEALRSLLGRSPEEIALVFQAQLDDSSLMRRLLPKAYVYHPQRTRGEFARYFRARARQTALPCAAQTRPRFVEVDLDDPWARRGIHFAPNGVGSLLLQAGVSHFVEYGAARCSVDARLEVTRTVLALAAYEEAAGGLPETLDVLVPDYLSEAPNDPFDGTGLGYSREARHVRSVGSDFYDAGGAPVGVWDAQEPTLVVPGVRTAAAATPGSEGAEGDSTPDP
jgi:hypothetical protein